MLATEIVRQVSLDLNDQESGYEYTRWPAAQLLSYLNEAVVYISQQIKDLFYDKVVVELEPGDVWQSACDCTKIIRVLGETTKDGSRILRRLRELADSEDLIWTGTKSCPDSGGLNGYMLSLTDDSSFKVFPPVSPADQKTHYVLLECYTIPDATAEGYDVTTELVIMVKQWMLFRAMLIDSENNSTITQIAQLHREEFHKLLADDIERRLREDMADGLLRTVPNRRSK